MWPWAATQVADVAQVPRCCGCGVGGHCSSDRTSSLETSICHRCGPKKTKKEKKNCKGEKKDHSGGKSVKTELKVNTRLEIHLQEIPQRSKKKL